MRCSRCNAAGAEEITIGVQDVESGELDDSTLTALCPACTAFIVGLVRSMGRDAAVN